MILTLRHLDPFFKRMKNKMKSRFIHVSTPFDKDTITFVIWDKEKEMVEKSEERLEDCFADEHGG